MDDNNNRDNSGESGAKTDALFTTLSNETQKQKKSGTELFYLVLNILGTITSAGFLIAIFTGRFTMWGTNEVIAVGRKEAIIGTVISLAVTAFSTIMSNRAAKATIPRPAAGTAMPQQATWTAMPQQAAGTVLPSQAPEKAVISPLARQMRRHKWLRIMHYALIGTMFLSFVAMLIVGPDNTFVYETIANVFIFAFFVFVPVLILFLVAKIKLRRLKKMGSA